MKGELSKIVAELRREEGGNIMIQGGPRLVQGGPPVAACQRLLVLRHAGSLRERPSILGVNDRAKHPQAPRSQAR